MTTLLVTMTAFVIYLVLERVALNKWRRSIPLLITVTGTRGKSSVVRLLASVLRSGGKRVLAKSTGTHAKFILPDGSHKEIRRRGPASIIEQKGLLRTAARLEVDCVVAEVMSIHSENHFVESRQILKPNIVVVTNAWPDHIAAVGNFEAEVTKTLCLDIPDHATVFVPSATEQKGFSETTQRKEAKLFEVQAGFSSAIVADMSEVVRGEFSENIDLVVAASRHLGLSDETIVRGLTTARQDVGTFSIRTIRTEDPVKDLYLVNGFAANDPQSTLRVLAKTRQMLQSDSERYVGLLCLRSDRADRSIQWLETLGGDYANQLGPLYVTGGHAAAFARRLPGTRLLKTKSAKTIMESIAAEVENRAVVFGFGNIVGTGQALVDYWDRKGVAYGI